MRVIGFYYHSTNGSAEDNSDHGETEHEWGWFFSGVTIFTVAVGIGVGMVYFQRLWARCRGNNILRWYYSRVQTSLLETETRLPVSMTTV